MRRVLPVLSFIVLVLRTICWCDDASAQDETITNANQLLEVIDESGLCFPLVSVTEPSPYASALGIFWTDCSRLTNAIGDVRNFEPETQYGVSVWRLRLTRTADGITFSYAPANTNLLELAATEDGFSNHYDHVLWTWCILGAIRNYEPYDDLISDGYTNLAPKRLVLDITLADINDCSAYEANVSGGGMLMMMSEEESDDLTPGFSINGDPCSITNLLQPFSIIDVKRTNDATTITWESCPIFRYRVLVADSLDTNTTWVSQSNTSYVWGQPGASATSWTDLSTTNTSVVTQRFYKVEKLLGDQIAAGGSHSLAILTNSSLWTWGQDISHQLGDDATDDEAAPVPITDPLCGSALLTNPVALTAGTDYSVAVDANGLVWSWGDGATGRLGNGGTTNVFTPSPISGISNVVSVAAGNAHMLALRADTTVWAWGDNANGELGTGGPLTLTNHPVLVAGTTQMVAIAAGYHHSVALDTSGRVWVWGYGVDGELGNGGSTNLTRPTMLTTISNVIAIAAGFDHTVALTTNKNVWTWGENPSGQLGDGTFTNSTRPMMLTNISNVVAIAAGLEFTLAVTSNGQVYGFGDNTYGELGTNTVAEIIGSPLLIAGVSNAVTVSAHPDGNHCLAVVVNQGTNQYYGWGDNSEGQVGDGGGEDVQYTPALLHFDDVCATCVPLGTSGSFTAQHTGTLKLYFNDSIAAYDNNGTNAYTARVFEVISTNVIVMGNNGEGVTVGMVTKGSNYTYTASGFCNWGAGLDDPNGNDVNHVPADCSATTGIVLCPNSHCFSLVGRIQ